MNGEIEWPREIWMAERDDHDQGIVSAVLSEHATVARFEGDTERAREFHRYVDADIYETAERYWHARVTAAYEAAAQEVDCGCKCRDDATDENARLQAQIETAKDALQRIDDASNHYAMTPTYSEGVLRYAHKSTRNLARAALKELENTDDRA